MRSALVLVMLAAKLAAAHPLLAEDPPPHGGAELIEWRNDPAMLEWSTWLGFGVGVASSPPAIAARGGAVSADVHTDWMFSAGVEATVPLSHRVRLGPWLGLHDLEPMIGGEVQVTASPADLDMFFYPGEGVWTVRAGVGADHMTAAIGWGYRCPWKLWGPYNRATRYEIGPRIMLAATRAYFDPKDWSATIGLEVEPVGALRYLLGIRSWY